MSDFHSQIGKRIRYLREKKGFTSQELAIMLDVEVELIDKFESGTIKLFVEHLSKMAILFNVTTDYIVYGIESRV